jgi:hypothetical protein
MENALLKKLNVKNHNILFVLNPPADPNILFGPVPLGSVLKQEILQSDEVEFAIGFAVNQKQLNDLAEKSAHG